MKRLALVLLLLACVQARPTDEGTERVRETGMPAPPALVRDTAWLLVGPEAVRPTRLHHAVWEMVEQCLNAPQRDVDVLWMTADTIVGLPTGRLAYGLLFRPRNRPPIIALDRAHWLNPTVISHEIIHRLAGAGEATRAMQSCQHQIGWPHPIRRVGPLKLGELVERGGILVTAP